MARIWCSLVLILLLASGCSSQPAAQSTPPEQQNVPAPAIAVPTVSKLTPPPVVRRARLLAVGDLLMHLPLVYSSAIPGGGWDFTPIFSHVRPWIEGADVAYANLETTLAGPDWPWSGYPGFNTPPQFARDLKSIGFDVVTNANNHSLDYDEPGLLNTIYALNQAGLVRTGTFGSPEQREEIATYTAGGITTAFFAYTYGTNGIPLPKHYNVNLLDPERIQYDIRRARKTPGIDLVAVALHFGNEYERHPNQQQKDLVALALSAGADIILGDHPHVLQRIEMQQVKDEHGRDLPRAVIYSLGNFVSNQVGMHRLQGVMLLVDMVKDEAGARVEATWFVPTWVHPYREGGATRYRIVVLEKAIADYEQGLDPRITHAEYLTMKQAYADAVAHLPGGPNIRQWRAHWPVSPRMAPNFDGRVR